MDVRDDFQQVLDFDQEDLLNPINTESNLRSSEIRKFILVERTQNPRENMAFEEQEEEDCDPLTRPADTESCILQPCPQTPSSRYCVRRKKI